MNLTNKTIGGEVIEPDFELALRANERIKYRWVQEYARQLEINKMRLLICDPCFIKLKDWIKYDKSDTKTSGFIR